VVAAASEKEKLRLADPLAQIAREAPLEEVDALSSGSAILVTRRLGGAGVDPNTFGFRWFWPSILRYRRPLAHVLIASLFVQLFALATPIFFQLVVDKVLVHKGMSTLVVLVLGMVTLGLFETILQFLRAYTLSHTTSAPNTREEFLNSLLDQGAHMLRGPPAGRAGLDGAVDVIRGFRA
jgi:ATP-binding cassette, subfamily B, bacterial HlyB/CyaB